MDINEFSSEFDIFYNNIMSNKAPGLSEYEKSVFLTRAQEQLVLDIYRGDFKETAFEDTEEVTSYIDVLVKQNILSEALKDEKGISPLSVVYALPENLWFITYESVILKDERLGCMDGYEAFVKPITQDRYYKIKNNPHKGANKRRVLRLRKDNKSELISIYNIATYLIRYITKPDPIILEDLDGVSIDGKTEQTECKLNPAIHRTIMERAAYLAKMVWEGTQER